jgi:hypothetical protein
MGDGSMGRLLVIGSSVRGKRDERGWCRLCLLLGVDVWLVDCTGVVLSLTGGGTGTLYLPPDVILL